MPVRGTFLLNLPFRAFQLLLERWSAGKATELRFFKIFLTFSAISSFCNIPVILAFAIWSSLKDMLHLHLGENGFFFIHYYTGTHVKWDSPEVLKAAPVSLHSIKPLPEVNLLF